jgi:D-alanyl-D-alanine carboxypeptidase (penicillin-binding protein 5/6)
MKTYLRLLFTAGVILFGGLTAVSALETKARTALVIDFSTGTVLLEKNADLSLPPASMSKLMTLNMVFEALDDGRLTMDEKLPVSAKAMSYGGSTMFLTTRDKVSVRDLIQGVIVLSGNDACVVLAEALAGSEEEFASAMTKRAKQLGMTNSRFANSNGWPDPNQRMSARDLVTLATRLIRVFPQYYHFFSEKEFPFDSRSPANRFNRNPLLKLDIGADGLKTGHTSEAGYGVVGSAVRNGRRVVLMISGLQSTKDRASEAAKLMNWAFRQFVEKKVLKAGDTVGQAEIWQGAQATVAMQIKEDVTAILPVSNAKQLKGEITVSTPVQAPITKGQELGTLTLQIPGLKSVTVPLVAANDVAKSGFLSRLGLSARILVQRLFALAN